MSNTSVDGRVPRGPIKEYNEVKFSGIQETCTPKATRQGVETDEESSPCQGSRRHNEIESSVGKRILRLFRFKEIK